MREPITRAAWMTIVEQIAEIEELIGEIRDAGEDDDIESAATLNTLTETLRRKRLLLKTIDVG